VIFDNQVRTKQFNGNGKGTVSSFITNFRFEASKIQSGQKASRDAALIKIRTGLIYCGFFNWENLWT